MTTLRIYWDDSCVAVLSRPEEDMKLRLQYLFGGTEDPSPLSASLPVTTQAHTGPAVAYFFDNLLPEGEVRTTLCHQLHLDGTDEFGLLSHIGAESAGALVILPEGNEPQGQNLDFEFRYQVLEDAYDLGQWLQALQAAPNAQYKGAATRLSLAGAQAKTAVARFADGRLYRSIGGATTHIIKLPGHDDRQYPHLALNEYFCACLASACGLSTSPVELLPYQLFRGGPYEHAYLIQRHDRVVDHLVRKVARLHQEDFCQALGRSRRHKYEEAEGITLSEIFGFVSNPAETFSPARERIGMLNAVLLNAALGNRDAHAKNYSLLRRGGKASLAPLYDLVCTEVYPDLSTQLPQRIGEAKVLSEVTPRDLDLLGEQIGLRAAALRRQAKAILDTVQRHLPEVAATVGRHPVAVDAIGFLEQIQAAVHRNVSIMQRWLA